MAKTAMTNNKLGFALGLAAALTVFGTMAQAADFTLYNDVRTPITGFYTQRPDGSWSPNWLSSPLDMGQSIGLNFAKSAVNVACVRNYRIVTSGDFAGSVDRVHNFCTELGLHMTANGPTHTAN
jgi:hypothetical protein